jgi:hypothetical protein
MKFSELLTQVINEYAAKVRDTKCTKRKEKMLILQRSESDSVKLNTLETSRLLPFS